MWIPSILLISSILCQTRLVNGGRPFPVFDDYIACIGDPPGPDNIYPAGRDVGQYNTNEELCSAVHGNTNNLGCICPGPDALVDCSIANGADPVLFNAPLSAAMRLARLYSFRTYCQAVCSCLSADDAEAFRAGMISEQQVAELGATDPFAETVPAGATFRGFAGRTPVNWPGAEAVESSPDNQTPLCAGACSSVGANCSAACECRVSSSTYNPATNQLLYAAACTLPFSLSGKRAEEALPCPCNSSYVSHSCCGAYNGVVWEPREMKLGELMKEL